MVEREWLSLGPRLQLEPAFGLVAGRDAGLEVFGRLTGDVGGAWFTEEYRDGDDRDEVWRWGGDAALGLRGRVGSLGAEAGWSFGETVFGETESGLFGKHGRTYVSGEHVFFGLSATF